MAKESMKAREVKRARLAAKYAERRAALKKIVNAAHEDDAEKRAAAYEAASGAAASSQEFLAYPHAQPLLNHRPSQRLHACLRHLAYPIPRNGFGRSDPRR